MDNRLQAGRGQTVPIHLGSMLAVLLASFFVYNWSTIVSLQQAAQNDANAAAELAILPQITQFNEMQLSLYASNIEEYRLRTLMESLLLNIRDSGGCDNTVSPKPSSDNFTQVGQTLPLAENCDLNYSALRKAYIDSLNRYTDDIQVLESVSDITSAQQQAAPVTMIADIQQFCTSLAACKATYVLNAFTSRDRSQSIGSVSHDAITYSFAGADKKIVGMPDTLLTPATADVTVCEKVSNLLPSVFGNAIGPAYIIARAAATPIASTQEWFEPGITINPLTNQTFQPSEFWGAVNTVDGTGWSSNMVNFSGNLSTASPTSQTYTKIIDNKAGEFSVYLSWWGSALVHPVILTTSEQQNVQSQLAAKGCGT